MLYEVITDPAEARRLGAAGRARATAHGWERTADALGAILAATARERVAASRAPAPAPSVIACAVAVWTSVDDLGGTIGTDIDILVSRSTNNGASWTAPAPLNTNAASDS